MYTAKEIERTYFLLSVPLLWTKTMLWGSTGVIDGPSNESQYSVLNSSMKRDINNDVSLYTQSQRKTLSV